VRQSPKIWNENRFLIRKKNRATAGSYSCNGECRLNLCLKLAFKSHKIMRVITTRNSVITCYEQ